MSIDTETTMQSFFRWLDIVASTICHFGDKYHSLQACWNHNMFWSQVIGLNHSSEATGGNCSKLFFLADFVFSAKLQQTLWQGLFWECICHHGNYDITHKIEVLFVVIDTSTLKPNSSTLRWKPLGKASMEKKRGRGGRYINNLKNS